MGDGTTSVVVTAGELLREAEQLVAQKVHPMTIIAGKAPAQHSCMSVLYLWSFVGGLWLATRHTYCASMRERAGRASQPHRPQHVGCRRVVCVLLHGYDTEQRRSRPVPLLDSARILTFGTVLKPVAHVGLCCVVLCRLP